MRSLLRTQTGSVTAELAITLPAVLLVASTLLGGMMLGVQRVQLAYAAGTLARAAARGEPPEPLAKQLGTEFRVEHLEDFVCVHSLAHSLVELEEVSCARKLGL